MQLFGLANGSAAVQNDQESPERVFLKDFRNTTRYFSLFHLAFLSLALVELAIFLLFFSFFNHSSLFAISLASLLLTGFSYFVLRFYFQIKKPEELKQLCKTYFSSLETALPLLSPKDHRLYRAHSAHQLVEKLRRSERTYYLPPPFLKNLAPILEKFSIWSYWKDVHVMTEMLLHRAIKEQIAIVKMIPTDLQVHWDLAQSYFALAKLYLHPEKWTEEVHPWISPEFSSRAMADKFQTSAQRVVEEYQIIEYYAPEDARIHEQLAIVYRLLNQPQEEITQHEIILKTDPQNPHVLLRLGILYFEQGMQAKGLTVYETLRTIEDSKAQELIAHYDAYL
jgi:tetratricopeptide (TPR) repeat protein